MPATMFWNIPKRVLEFLEWKARQNGTTVEEEFLKMKDRGVRTRFEWWDEAERRRGGGGEAGGSGL